jgi:hypothetical protein
MPDRRLLRKKSRSRRSSTNSFTHQKTRLAKKQRPARKQRGTTPTAGKRSQSLGRLRRRKAGKRLVADMAADPSLVFTPTALKRGLDPRWVLREFGSQFEKDSSGRIRAKARSRRGKTLYIPTATPGVRTPVPTRNKRERKKVGKWMAALNAAGRGDFSKMKKLPRKLVIGGVRLETSPKKVQEILTALAEQESPYEGLYRSIVRPS